MYDCYDKTLKTGPFPNDRYHYFKFKNDKFSCTDEGLKDYVKLFKVWCEKLKEAIKIVGKNKSVIAYAESLSDFYNVIRLFNYFCKKNYKKHQQITPIEYKWYEMAANSGQVYLKEKDIKLQCYGYDYSKYYGRNLGSTDLFIPTREGTEYKIKMLNDNLEPGFYKVKITCDNDDFRKIFTFSKDNVYLNTSIEFARKYQEEFDVSIELITDVKYNALIYSKKYMISINSITKEWHDFVMDINAKLPKNKLLKFLISACWGVLSETNTVNKTEK